MVIKVYISGISGNKEVKKRQQRIIMILDSKGIKYDTIDITEPGKEDQKLFMQENAESKGAKHPLPPQIFNEEEYCGDYDDFDVANENDTLENFLNVPAPEKINGNKAAPVSENILNNEENHMDTSIRPEEIIEQLAPPPPADSLMDNITKSLEREDGPVEDGDEIQTDDNMEADSSMKEDEEEEEAHKSDENEDQVEGEE